MKYRMMKAYEDVMRRKSRAENSGGRRGREQEEENGEGMLYSPAEEAGGVGLTYRPLSEWTIVNE